MSHSVAIDLPRDSAAETEANGWSARRRLACLVALSAASWLVILTPLMIWG